MNLLIIGHGDAAAEIIDVFQSAFHHYDISATVDAWHGTPDDLDSLVARLRSGSLIGAYVGGNLGRDLYDACDSFEGDSVALGRINGLVATADGLVGDHSGAVGMELGLSVHKMWPEDGCRAVVLGGGDDAACALLAMKRVPAREIIISAPEPERPNRDDGNRRIVVKQLDWGGSDVVRALGDADIVITCEDLGNHDLPFSPSDLDMGCTVADLRGDGQPSGLVAAMRETQRRAIGGAEVLIHTTMLSFARWTGLKPPFEVARVALAKRRGVEWSGSS